MDQVPVSSRRRPAEADVRQLVWKRDGGKCRSCGSNTELQLDHIIPVAYGGATTVDNLQVLCGPCNRRKGASVS
ncbi:HNH endonuclease signature motif containing protein [Frondihabitans sp. PAMC 28766]|uniref:HNH endonuclease n=1 Tax=Frondihabitans sp. PAMC 28766 TaxID=1795630 RepID=UPI0009E980F1